MLPRLIAIDMDGTLLGPEGQVSPRNLAALQLAQERGIEVVIATGRRHCYAMKPLRELNLCENNALISSNGTVIRSVGADLLHRSHLNLETTRWLIDYASDFRETMMLTFDTVQPGGEDCRGALVCEYNCVLDEDIGKWMDSNRKYIVHVDRLEDALNGAPPIQMMACGPVSRMRELIALLLENPRVAQGEGGLDPRAEITLHRTEYPDRDLMILDILPAGISKASALEHLAELRGCTTAEIMAIGDNWNDLPMLEISGQPVVMANAPDKLRGLAEAHGWPVTASNAEDGVAQAIEAILQPAFA